MDKYEFNIKVEQIKKMVNRSDYETAMKIADTIDWRRVRNVNILSMVATIYEKNEEFQEAKDILLLAFERAPIGKRLLFKLAELAIKEGSVGEAEDYYREFCDLAPDDPRQYILRYLILGAKGAPVEQLIHTLEQYCNIELDEKWLYELAELYNEAGMGELCVMTCDKIMLMFGLGKYVDKAMELKLQYAPLTKYQMDLVENRDKYEAKLKAVEQEFISGKPSYQADRESAYTREPRGYEDQPEEEDVPEEDRPVYGRRTQIYEDAPSAYEQEPEVYEEEHSAYEQEPEIYEEEPSAYEQEPEVYQEESDTYEEEPEAEEPFHTPVTVVAEETEDQWEVSADDSRSLTGDELKARLHEAEAQANLAMEMSKLSEEGGCSQEPELAQTRVLTDIRELNKGPIYCGSNHLMIEADIPEEGLNLAIEALRKIHQETGAKNQAAKITGDKLNRRGIFTISDKLTGKDLIIEQAGDMNESILQELNQLMARDETGMSIVLIDTAERLEELHRVYPGLAKRFECIGTSESAEKVQEKVQPEVQEDKRPVRQVQPVRQSETAPAPKAVKTARHPQAVSSGAQRRSEAPVQPASKPEPVKPARAAVQQSQPVRSTARPEAAAASEEDQPEIDTRPVIRVQPKRDNAPAPIPTLKKKPVQQEEPSVNEEEEMDIDEFAKYACQYASDIDCSISGKSMLALYERIEIMEEEGIPLTRASAEDLIEEAADRAENPALMKRVTGIFSSKYDKDGLLILKEEHFI